MKRFKDCHLARMSHGHYCVIQNSRPVKGGKDRSIMWWSLIAPVSNQFSVLRLRRKTL
jgi:hypothetical protein